MRSKAPLVLMEQLVMVVVFALTAAICLRMFVLTNTLSQRYSAVDRAVLLAQNAAEEMKQKGPERYLQEQNARWSENAWQLSFDRDWNRTEGEEAAYHLFIHTNENKQPFLWSANIQVSQADETVLFEIPVSGQEERR